MTRSVHLKGFSRLARGEVNITVDRVGGLVTFREKHKRKCYCLSLDEWIGLGFDHAVKAYAFAERQNRLAERRARKG